MGTSIIVLTIARGIADLFRRAAINGRNVERSFTAQQCMTLAGMRHRATASKSKGAMQPALAAFLRCASRYCARRAR